MPLPRIAFVTYAAAPQLTPDDRLLRAALEAAGGEVHPLIWDEPNDWTGFDLVILRSTWDYFLKPDEFAAWLSALQASGAEVLNPLSMVRWNGTKRYLLDLEKRGVEIVPTMFVAHGERIGELLVDLLESHGWADAVVKPAISGGAHATWRTSIHAATSDESRFAALRGQRNGGVLIQPFMPEIVADGELSLIFLDGAYSHAALKRASAGDFRVQQEHGGQYAPYAPTGETIEQAERILDSAAASTGVAVADLLYARVDGIIRRGDGGPGRFVLMELECIEPSLFFMQHPPAAERMARSIVGRIALRAGA